MKVKLIAPARKPEWGEDFWENKTLRKITKKASGTILALPTLAALTPPDVEVSITDEKIEPVDFNEKVDLVGISSATSLAPRAYEIADGFRASGAPVVLGGIHASMLPQEAIQHADSIVIGEAEDVWPKLINDFQKGKLQQFYQAPNFTDLKKSPVPRWDLLKTDAYLYFIVQTGRGCPYDCDFCSVKVFNGRKYRHKPIENVIKEIKTLQKIDPRKIIFFADDNLLAVPSHAKTLLEAIAALKIKDWTCQCSVNRLKDDELLNLLYKAGCGAILIGFESVSGKSLELMNKSKVNKADEYKEIIEKVHSYGIEIFGSFILGSDTDDESIFEKTLRFIDGSNLVFAVINVLTPFPGTSLYQRFQKEGRILHQNWEKYNTTTITIKPKLMSPEALQEGSKWVGQQIYAYSSFYKRFNNFWNSELFVERERDGILDLFSKERIFLTLRNLPNWDIKRTYFLLKSLWKPQRPSISILDSLLGLDFHDYYYSNS